MHTSSVAVVPPAPVWRRLQALRCSADKSFVRWPPHINLLYPFYPDGSQTSESVGASEGEESDDGSGGRGCTGGRGHHSGRRGGPGIGSRASAYQEDSIAEKSVALDDPGGLAAAQLQLQRAPAGGDPLLQDPFGGLAERAARALARIAPFMVGQRTVLLRPQGMDIFWLLSP